MHRVLSLCSGIGGIELGLSRVIDCCPVAFVEKDLYCKRVLMARFPGVPVFDDIFAFSPVSCDLITAGFPCQPWSGLGRRKGKKDEKWIWPEIARIVRDCKPRAVFLENVPGLACDDGLSSILWDLAALGFDAEWGVFSNQQLGAPHSRKRLFLLANCSSQGQPRTWKSGEIKVQSEPTDALRDVGDGPLADSDRPERFKRLEQRGESEPSPAFRPTFWPPGPTVRLWDGVLPSPSERRLSRLADGIPQKLERSDYSHRVRALGNAVSPPVAAVAFSVLGRRIGLLNDTSLRSIKVHQR